MGHCEHHTKESRQCSYRCNSLAAFNKKNVKAKRTILDTIKDHVIPHVAGKTNVFEMWASLTKLYQSSNENRKMVLREKLKNIKMIYHQNHSSS
jgi:hypothetical protein